MSQHQATLVADAVLYEGYVLYPYRASTRKNQIRFPFGALVPPAFAAHDPSERAYSQTECLLEAGPDARVAVQVRFLHLQVRVVEELVGDAYVPVESMRTDGGVSVTWDEAVEVTHELDVTIADLAETPRTTFRVPGVTETEPLTSHGQVVGRLLRQRWPVSGSVSCRVEELPGPYGVVRLQVRVENDTSCEPPPTTREAALRQSLLAVHFIARVHGGGFVSLLEPPQWARPAVDECTNVGAFPILLGEPGTTDVLLSSPIILYDYPQIAAESAGDLHDGTEIDEILTLRTLALTDAEKEEARATDPRAAAIIDRVDSMSPEVLARLHGTMRDVRAVDAAPETPWWDPGSDARVSPGTDVVMVDGVPVGRGARVRLTPGLRRADAHDMFLAERVATVEAVFFDVDGAPHLAVLLEDDPAADLLREQGRYLYFAPDEVAPVDEAR